MLKSLWQTTIHQTLHTSVGVDRRCLAAANHKMDTKFGVVFAGSVVFANGSAVSLRSMVESELSGEGSLAGAAARATTADPSGLQPTTARWIKSIAIAKPSESDGRKYQDEYQYDETIDQLNNRILGRWSHVPGPDRHRNRGAS